MVEVQLMANLVSHDDGVRGCSPSLRHHRYGTLAVRIAASLHVTASDALTISQFSAIISLCIAVVLEAAVLPRGAD